MAQIYNTKSNTLLSGTSGNDDIRNGGRWDYSYHDGGSKVTISGNEGNDYIVNTGENVSISGGTGSDEISNGGADVTINGGDGNDWILDDGLRVKISGGDGDDTIYNQQYHGISSNESLSGGDGNDSIENLENTVTISGGTGSDTIYNQGANVLINGGEGSDSIDNWGYTSTIAGGTGNDSIENHGYNVTISGDTGNDTIYNGYGSWDEHYGRGSNVLFTYSEDDGNDTIFGFKSNSTLSVSSGSYSSMTSGNDVIIKVGDGSITLKDAAPTALNIIGTYDPNSSSGGDDTPTDGNGGNDTSIPDDDTSSDGGGDDNTPTPDDSSNTPANNDKPYWTLDDLKVFLDAFNQLKSIGKLNDVFDITARIIDIFESVIDISQNNKTGNDLTGKLTEIVSNVVDIIGDVKSLKGKDNLFWSLAASGLGCLGSYIATLDIDSQPLTDEKKKALREKLDNLAEAAADLTNESVETSIKALSKLSSISQAEANVLAKQARLKANAAVSVLMAGYAGFVQYQESVEKYSAEELPLSMVAGQTFIDAITVGLHGGIHQYTYGLDDLAFKGLRWVFSFGQAPPTDKDYMEWIGEFIKRGIFGSSSADDTLETDHNGKTLYAQGGDDYIRNVFSNVKIYGGDGNDTIFSHEGARRNYLNGNAGRDYIFALDTKSTAIGASENDILMSSGDGNSISGGEGIDFILLENASENIVNGGTETDIISIENSKNTVIYYAKGDGNDIIFGYDGDDTIHVAGKTKYSVTENGQDIYIKIGDDIIILKDAIGKNINIENRDTAYNPLDDIDPFDINPVINNTISRISARAAENVVTDTDSLENLTANGTAILTFTENSGRGIQNADLRSSEYPQVVSLEGGNQNIQFNDKDGNIAIVGASAAGSKNIIFGNGDDLGIFLSPKANINVSVGAGNDSVLVDNNARVRVDMTNADSAMIVPYSGKVTLDGYDVSTRSSVMLPDVDDIVGAINDNSLQIIGDAIKLNSSTSIEVNDSSTDSTFVNLIGTDGRKTIFGWSPQSGGIVDGNDIDKPQVLYGDAPDGNSTIRGGIGNDTILAGAKDVVSLSGGHDDLYINDETSHGVTVDMGDGSAQSRTRVVEGFDVARDLLKIDSPENINARILDGSLQFIKGDSRVTFDELATFDDANGLQVQVDGTTYELRNDYDSGLSDEDYFWTDTDGNYYITDSTFRIFDDGATREYFIGEGSGKRTIDGFNFGRDNDKLNLNSIGGLTAYGDNLYIASSDSDIVEVTGGAGKTIDVKLDGTTYTAQLGKHLTYDLDAEYFGDLHGGTDCAISVAANFAQEEVAIYLNEEEEADGKVRYYGGVTKIDASAFTGQASLVGSEFNDQIIAARGATSLWGGESGDDELFGTGSDNSFFYCMGNGDDKIYNAADGDAVNLVDIRLEDITNSAISAEAVTLELSDGGRLTVMNSADVTFNLGDGTSWKADRQAKEWQQQA